MDQNEWTDIATNRPSSTDDTLLEESLEEYIRAAYPAIDTDTENDVPTSASNTTSTSTPSPSTQQAKTTTTTAPTARQKPVLKKGRTNRILLYNGCFNPPHQGHLAHLAHAYRHAGADLHVVGAIVLVAGDQYLKWKMGRAPGTLRLSEAQRIDLWNRELRTRGPPDRDGRGGGSGSGSADWCWVVPENQWNTIADELERLFDMDGFEVEFVRLAGGDKVGLRGVQHGVWGCRMMITTDISRPVEFCEGGGGGEARLKDLAGHTKWRRVQQDGVVEDDGDLLSHQPCRIRRREPRSPRITPVPVTFRGEEHVGLTALPAPIAHERKREVWVCESAYGARDAYTVRFVSSTRQERFDPDLSSTKLREIITEATTPNETSQDEGRLEDKLRGVALSPELLAQFIREKIEQDGKEMEEWVKRTNGTEKEETFAEGGEEMGRDPKKQRRDHCP
ncbi:hypothetical protein F4776DRAFT_432606 [Hypoxylon sp. NC0597]|nr:hypothetical protein F4776DRAFT_432606 [Hypoxylon sp. NC0597]